MVLELDSYKTEIKDADVSGINEFLNVSNDFDINIDETIVNVDYELQVEARKWGIKYICVVPTLITCRIDWEVSTDELKEEEKQIFIVAGGKEYIHNNTICGCIEFTTTDISWKVESEVEFGSDGGLSISNTSIDLVKKLITVS